MRRRFALGVAVTAVALALIGPASVSAASSGYSLDMLTNTCVTGTLTSGIRVVAGGGTSANRIEIGGGLQQLRGRHWRQVPFSLFFDAKDFRANGRQHSMKANWGPNAVDSHRKMRVWWSIQVLDGDTVLWSLTAHSLGCATPA